MGYLYVAASIVFTVYGQLIIKWRVGFYNVSIAESHFAYILQMITDPYVLSGFASAFMAAIFWMMALTKLELSRAYPCMSLSFVAVLILSGLLFSEPITTAKSMGVALIVGGVIVGAL